MHRSLSRLSQQCGASCLECGARPAVVRAIVTFLADLCGMPELLVTAGASTLGRAVADAFIREGRAVRLHPGGPLEHGDATDALVAGGIQEVIYVEPALWGAETWARAAREDEWIDRCTRCLYNLLNSATAAGVKRLTVLGSMNVFQQLQPSVAVMARFMPRPTCDPSQLGPWLAEYTAREFAVCGAMHIVAARLGTLVATEDAGASSALRWWVTPENVGAALTSELAITPGQQSQHGGLPAAGFVPSYEKFRAVNIGRGDGREVTPDGLLRDSWWQQSNGGRLSAATAAKAAAEEDITPSLAATSARVTRQPQHVLILGASGMLGPDVVRCLMGEIADHDGDPAQTYRLRQINIETALFVRISKR